MEGMVEQRVGESAVITRLKSMLNEIVEGLRSMESAGRGGGEGERERDGSGGN